MMAYPGVYNMDAPQGATLNRVLTWKIDGTPVNLTGFTARMQVRPTATSSTVYLSLTSGSGLTLGGVAGTITVNATATQMAAVPAGQHAYDIELVSGAGEVTRLVAGLFKVSAEVTR